jgi:hypothetical protein
VPIGVPAYNNNDQAMESAFNRLKADDSYPNFVQEESVWEMCFWSASAGLSARFSATS